jgi:hypothetical protein
MSIKKLKKRQGSGVGSQGLMVQCSMFNFQRIEEKERILDRINRIDRINFPLPGWQGKK